MNLIISKIQKIIANTVDNRGQTLVEVTLATGVMAFALITSIRLAISTIQISSESGRRTQAENLVVRELEALRTHRDGIGKATPSQTLWDYLSAPGRSSIMPGTGCRQFVVSEDPSSITGWQTSSLSASAQAEAYSPAGFTNGGFLGVDGFNRLITLCREFGTIVLLPAAPGPEIYNISIKIEWEEGGPTDPIRDLTIRTILRDPDKSRL